MCSLGELSLAIQSLGRLGSGLHPRAAMHVHALAQLLAAGSGTCSCTLSRRLALACFSNCCSSSAQVSPPPLPTDGPPAPPPPPHPTPLTLTHAHTTDDPLCPGPAPCSGGEDVVYTSVQDFVNDMADGVFGLDLTAPDLGIESLARLREQMAQQLQAQQDVLAAQQAAAVNAASKAAAGGGSVAGQQAQPSTGQAVASQEVPGEHRVVTQVLPGGWKVVTRTSSSPSLP